MGGATMQNIDVDQLGPVDYLVIEFPGEEANLSNVIAAELTALTETDTVRVLDLLLLRKRTDGTAETCELREATDSEVGRLRALGAELAVRRAEEDVEGVGRSMEGGSRAAGRGSENR